MLLPEQTIEYTELMLLNFKEKKVKVTMARLDLIHPVVSGNKLYKLFYFLKEAEASGYKTLLTFGGAYSNHLVATAYASNQLGFKSIGIVRGERPPVLSHTLEQCIKYEMQLQFVSRNEYNTLQHPGQEPELLNRYGKCLIIPEGGYAPKGASGAALVMKHDEMRNATHICTAVGTATTLAGLLLGCRHGQEIIAVPVLKGMHDIPQRIRYLGEKDCPENLSIFTQYHFGGYARHTIELTNFMNKLFRETQVPTDFVYTAKMMFAVYDKIQKSYFPPGSTIMCIHTGGLQGNLSLPAGTIIF